MKRKQILTMALLGYAAVCLGQQNATWDKWDLLAGKWAGEISGEPGKGIESFSFEFDLNKKILVKRGHYEFLGTGTAPKVVHDDLMIVYSNPAGIPSRAIYFDNLGHTINYSAITYSDKSIELRSDKIANVPAFRLTYRLLDNETVDSKFDISQDGAEFTTHVEGRSKKVK